MAKAESKNGEAVKKECPAASPAVTPEITPPGVVVTPNTHGRSTPLPRPANLPVVERLRAAMKLSGEVPADQVVSEAIERLAKGQ